MNTITQNEEEILNKLGIDIFPVNRKYWFVRTQKGTYYEDFLNDKFIGIEWDRISDLDYIKNSNDDDLREEVVKQYPKLDKPGYVASQIYKFCNTMKSGDIVLIPSKESKWITIGEILDDSAYLYTKEQEDFQELLDDFYGEQNEDAEKTLLMKRRNMRWIKTVKKTELDPYLYSIIYSHNAIVDAQPYSIFIDRMLSQFYIKGDEGYFTYKINKKNNIPYEDMLNFLNNNNTLMNYINEKFPELKFEKNKIIIKVNVQSKGPIQIKATIKTILIVGLCISGLFGANFDINVWGAQINLETEGLPKLIKTIADVMENKNSDQELKTLMEKFNIDKDNLEITVPKLEQSVTTHINNRVN